MKFEMKEKHEQCVWEGCPFDAWHDNCCKYHNLLINYWFYELDGAKYTPAELTFTMTCQPAGALYPETADPDAATYRARYQTWAKTIGSVECDRIVVEQGGKPWKDYFKTVNT